jgi:hypothetical protein
MGACALAGTRANQGSADGPPRLRGAQRKARQCPGREIAGGAGNIGGGAAKRAGHLARGAGNGAVDLVTLHPIDAGVSVGRGAVNAGRDVGVGAARMTHGIGRAIGKVF